MFHKITLTLVALFALAGMMFQPAVRAASKPPYTICHSRYAGWEPWLYADSSGILAKWAKKYGIEITIVPFNDDYVESLNQYTAGNLDGCVMTNMDALTMPALGGVDSTVLIYGDYSNGNDGVVSKTAKSMKELKGRETMLVMLTVSHYLLARAFDKNGMAEGDVPLVNTSNPADIVATFMNAPKATVVTWNPYLQEVRGAKGAKLLFDSSQIPGEIMDLMVVRTDSPEELKRALVGAWYETMEHMLPGHPKRDEAIAVMAKNSGATPKQFEAQLKTTAMFYKAADAAKFVRSPDVKKTMQYVVDFSFSHDLYSGKAKDDVGIEYPDGTVQGNPKNVKLRFNASYMQLAADGKL